MRKPFERFGCDVFTDNEMHRRLDPAVYKALKHTIDEGGSLSFDTAAAVADAMKDWALEKGATHYTHWFQPMTSSTAQKHDSFIDIDDASRAPILKFSGKALIKGEADGSSFPSGGLRATFEARGYTTWDCTSPAFVRRDDHGSCVLCIPTAFCAFSGEALDEKTPLLRSMEAIDKQALRVLRLLGDSKTTRVIPTVGGEQEYFLIDKRHFHLRKDLVYTGRTLFGAAPSKGQELFDQYYASTPQRVVGFMRELDDTLWRMGVMAKTEHNESAPAQYELAPIYASANIATDHNQIIMEQMRRVAEHHGFTCLLHEKPFDGVNGSGKHDNWSLITDSGINLLKPIKGGGKVFYTFLVAVIAAVDTYAGAMRMSCATIGNEHRLGGDEAPPQVLCVYTGAKLYEELIALMAGNGGAAHEKEHMHTGVSTLAVLHKDDTDRNRTSPFAFTGDKFEFRMVGASQSLGLPNTVLNTIVAQLLCNMADELEGAQDFEAAWHGMIARYIKAHKKIIYNGNNYSAQWREEAKRRGLPDYKSTVDAIALMADEDIQGVFQRQKVLSKGELMARRDVAFWGYSQMARIEASTMLKISRQKLLPACVGYMGDVAGSYNETKRAGLDSRAQARLLQTLNEGTDVFSDAIEALSAALKHAPASPDDPYALALYMRDKVLPCMQSLRLAADSLERVVSKSRWPLPSYGEMLFHII